MEKVGTCYVLLSNIFSNLRMDTLAQMLTMGNVRANSTVLVVDSCLGLVTGAVLERLGGQYKFLQQFS